MSPNDERRYQFSIGLLPQKKSPSKLLILRGFNFSLDKYNFVFYTRLEFNSGTKNEHSSSLLCFAVNSFIRFSC